MNDHKYKGKDQISNSVEIVQNFFESLLKDAINKRFPKKDDDVEISDYKIAFLGDDKE